MNLPLATLDQRKHEDWLIGHDSQKFFALAQQHYEDLQARSPDSAPLTILLAESNPLLFLAKFIAAVAANCHICLANPTWRTSEWQQALTLIQPDLVWANLPISPLSLISPISLLSPTSLISPTSHPSPLILIPTGGSSGKLRFAMHTWNTLIASVQGFQQFFGQTPVHSCCVLPLHHVSGLMQFLRSFTSGGNLAILPFQSLETALPTAFNPQEFFLSLVPTQLQRLLKRDDRVAWLRQFHTVLLGGAPAWAELLDQARANGIRLAPTYGMTETASQVATLKPDEFLSGITGCGRVLPHAQITLQDQWGNAIADDRPGSLTIQAKSLALGYYPTAFTQAEFQPDDLGYLDAHGYLHLVGRSSDKIITGGENVFPAEVEAAIRTTGFVADVGVIGMDDRHWGQAIVAVYAPLHPATTASQLQAAIAPHLSKFKHPKHWIAVAHLPRNAQGKVSRMELRAIAQAHLRHATEPTIG